MDGPGEVGHLPAGPGRSTERTEYAQLHMPLHTPELRAREETTLNTCGLLPGCQDTALPSADWPDFRLFKPTYQVLRNVFQIYKST